MLVPVPTEPCSDDLNAVGIKDRCERANEARIGEGRKSLLTTTITTATSTPAPALAPTMSHSGFEFAAELAVVGAEVEPVPLGNSTEGPAEAAVVGVPLGNKLDGEVEVGV